MSALSSAVDALNLEVDRYHPQPLTPLPYTPSSKNFKSHSANPSYVTTAINYANGPAHMGHAYEGVTADVIARCFRMGFQYTPDSTKSGGYFVTGSDEHGQKIAGVAEEKGVEPIVICDKFVNGFQNLNRRMYLSNEDYIRTTSDRHKASAQEMWKRVGATEGDIYLSDYEGWYNVREETFVTENDAQLSDYKDPLSGKPLTKVTESSYFFKMSKYQQRLVEHIENNPNFVQPESQRKFILARLKEPLRDLSISRTTFDWGIRVPSEWNQDHVMYVWFDALSNYATGADLFGVNAANGEDPKFANTDRSKLWPPEIHLIGKDIIWFHVVIWPCMLMSANIPLPTTIYAHGFINDSEGKKMSKTFGNVIDPHTQLDKFSLDTFRWYLCKESPFGGELSFSEESLATMHNADLCDTLGNLVHRATNLAKKYCGGVVPSLTLVGGLPINLEALKTLVREKLSRYELENIAHGIMAVIRDVNKYLTEAEPWKIKGEDDESVKLRQTVILTTLESIYIFSHFLAPFCPNAGAIIEEKLNTPFVHLSTLKDTQNLAPGTPISIGEVLFTKIVSDEEKTAAEQKAKKAADAEANLKKKKAEKELMKKKALAAKSAAGGADDNQPDFTKMEIRVGKVEKVWLHPEADKLYCEDVNVGEEAPRQIVSGLRSFYSLEEMEGRLVCVVCNLKSSKMLGVVSSGMVLAAKNAEGVTELVSPPEGSVVGERLFCEGEEGEPQSSNVVKKRKTWDTVMKNLKVDGTLQACHDGKPIKTKSGICVVKSLCEGSQIQ